jgi:hypothetical protein
MLQIVSVLISFASTAFILWMLLSYIKLYNNAVVGWSNSDKSLNMLLDLHDVNKPNFYGATIAFRCGGLIGGEVVKFPRPLSLIEAASYVGFIWSDICADAHAYEEDFDEPVRFRIVGSGGLVIPYRM